MWKSGSVKESDGGWYGVSTLDRVHISGWIRTKLCPFTASAVEFPRNWVVSYLISRNSLFCCMLCIDTAVGAWWRVICCGQEQINQNGITLAQARSSRSAIHAVCALMLLFFYVSLRIRSVLQSLESTRNMQISIWSTMSQIVCT